ncbi:MAG: protein-glutamate O-methyltransferase CheR [Bacteroidia bacterium]|nr:protein-glutamate O-methyltransferase CheR [Bacteroidia bacterium]
MEAEETLAVPIEEIQLFIETVKGCSEYNFSDYSVKSLSRRLEKVLIDNKTTMANLVTKIRNNKDFLEKTVRDITVNTTELFRDPKAWHAIKYGILPQFKDYNTVNIWHAGCSTGQEVYSMLILLYEMDFFHKANVFASDINIQVLEEAKKGVYKYRFNIEYLDNFDKVIKENPYNPDEHTDVPYSKYFDINKVNDIIKMKQFLVAKPVFKKHDLVKPENVFYTKFDLIVCRNVLIYFNFDLQNRIFDFFHDNLFDSGFLLLGMHESMLGPITAKYDKRGLIYRKK